MRVLLFLSDELTETPDPIHLLATTLTHTYTLACAYAQLCVHTYTFAHMRTTDTIDKPLEAEN